MATTQKTPNFVIVRSIIEAVPEPKLAEGERRKPQKAIKYRVGMEDEYIEEQKPSKAKLQRLHDRGAIVLDSAEAEK